MRIRTFLGSTLLALAVSASAQFPGAMPSAPMRYNTALLMNPQVQKDMHLSPEAAQKSMNIMITVASKHMASLMGSMTGKPKSAAERAKEEKEILAVNDEIQSQTLKLLTPSQKVRLREISLQQGGGASFSDPQLCHEVGLSAKQTSTIQATLARIASKAMSQMGGGKGLGGMMSGPGGKPDISGMMATQKKAKQDSDAAVNAILTPSQKARYEKLKGRPIVLKGSMGMGGMFGGM